MSAEAGTPRMQCAATRERLNGGVKRCPRPARFGEWCRNHAQSLGGYVLVSPQTAHERERNFRFYFRYRCIMVGCEIVDPHEHGGGQPMREMTIEERAALRAVPA